MVSRTLLIVSVLGMVGICAAVVRPVVMYARMHRAEQTAAAAMTALVDAQRAFRAAGGNGGYATDLASLTTPCPGQSAPALAVLRALSAVNYAMSVRPAEGAPPGFALDCHGRPTAGDYYASVAPTAEVAGRQALAVTARGRIYVFFDGLPPRERDMARGGLAVPLDRLPAFKIP